MSLANASQAPQWEKLALYGLHAKSQKLGFNSYAGRTRRARAVCPETRERAPRALVKPRRGFDRDGRLLAGWVLLSCGVATYAG
jgi:hypothetical protein